MGTSGRQDNLQVALGVRVPLSARVAMHLTVAGRWAGEPQARDSLLTVPLRLLDSPAVVWTLSPGASLPTGTVGVDGDFTPLSTGSVDPWLASSVVAGSAWLVTGMGQLRPSLYAGRDGVVQGTYWRGDLGVARRLGDHVVRIGVSSAGVTQDFSELALSAGAVISTGEQLALAPWLRLPLTDEGYTVAGGLSLTWVAHREEDMEDEDEDADEDHDH